MNKYRRLAGAALAAAVLAACGGGPATGAPTPAASPSASASTRPAATSTPTAAACRLPVASGDAPSDGNSAHGTTGHGGFLTPGDGRFVADTQSLAAYDLAVARWLPVRRAWVAPDGKRYAYPEYRSVAGPATGIIHVVDVAGGADHPVTVPAPSTPISWEGAGIYVARAIPNSDAPPMGLSLLDPATGQLKQLTADGQWTAIGTTFAYGTDLDPSAAAPTGPAAGPGAGNRLRKLDLASGAVTNVQTYPGVNVQVLGVHGDNPVLALIDASSQETVVDGPATLYKGSANGNAPTAPIVVDGATIWLSGAAGVWRSIGGAAATGLPVPALQLAMVAGACR